VSRQIAGVVDERGIGESVRGGVEVFAESEHLRLQNRCSAEDSEQNR
jgi:hypothetical protein